jgi:hypothetical protein
MSSVFKLGRFRGLVGRLIAQFKRAPKRRTRTLLFNCAECLKPVSVVRPGAIKNRALGTNQPAPLCSKCRAQRYNKLRSSRTQGTEGGTRA